MLSVDFLWLLCYTYNEPEKMPKTYTFTIDDLDADLLANCLSIACNSYITAGRPETSKMVADMRQNFRNQRRVQDETEPQRAPSRVKQWEALAVDHALMYLRMAMDSPENLERCVRPLSIALPAMESVLAPLASQRTDYKPCVPQNAVKA